MSLELRLRAPVIELDAATHQYTVDGVPKRSWSQIAREANLLEDLSGVPAHHLENAKARGSQIDDACSLIMEDRFPGMNLVHPEAQPYVDAYWQFWATRHVVPPLFVQTALYCAELDFCCTPDWHDAISVNDIKATAKCSRTWGLQTAAQGLAHGNTKTRRIIWLRPKLRSRQYEVHTDDLGQHVDQRIFSKFDHEVVKAACRGDNDADVIQRWRAGA